jgi:hypothetical protein
MMQSDSFEYRILAAVWWHECEKTLTGMKEIRNKLSIRFQCDSPDGRIIKKWEEKLFRCGSLNDNPRSGRPSEHGDEMEDICASVLRSPQKSLRQRSSELNIPQTTLHSILTKEKFRPWKPTFLQYLSEEDKVLRVNCCNEILRTHVTENARNNIFFSDECSIYSESKTTQTVWWSKENPHYHIQLKKYPPSIMVWAAMNSKYLIGPFFITGTVNSNKYIELLENEFKPELQRLHIYNQIILQQDGSTSHTAYATRDYLNENYPNRWIGINGPISWPPRSPDLTSCDNALWGIIKKKTVAKNTSTIPHLKIAIAQAFREIDRETLRKIHKRTLRRISLCTQIGGNQVDPYDKI